MEFLLYVSWNASLIVKVIISLNNLQQPEQTHAICHLIFFSNCKSKVKSQTVFMKPCRSYSLYLELSTTSLSCQVWGASLFIGGENFGIAPILK